MTLVVCDVDGTLVDKQKRLSEANVAAVKRLRAHGFGFTLISARPVSGMMPLAERLALDVPMAAFNGGIISRRDGSIAEHHTIPGEVARGVFEAVADAPVDRWVFAEDRWYASTDQGVHVDHERLASAQEPIVRGGVDELLDAADKITFVSDDHALLATLAERVKPFADRATIVQSQVYYLDVTARAANKGDGVAALAHAIGVSLAKTIAIGDQANDLAMFARAGRSIAMGNATDAVKAEADDVTIANDADGVAHAIDNLILGRMM